MKIQTSIIIPTLHRKKSLIRLLHSLIPGINKSIEIIIVEQGVKNEEVIKRIAKKYKIRLAYIYLSTPSMTHARNVGVKVAKGKYVLFLDDDTEVRPELPQNHIRNFKDVKVAATCGRCTTPGQSVQKDFTKTGTITWYGKVIDGYSSTVRQTVDTVIGCNMCWRKDIYVTLGGVDEQFTGNALREETDLSFRAKQLGYTIIFEPEAEIVHLRATTGGARKTEGRMQWYFHFLSNETYFYLKHFPKILFPIYILTKSEWILRCMFGFGREVSFRSIITPWLGIIDGFRKHRRLLKYYTYWI